MPMTVRFACILLLAACALTAAAADQAGGKRDDAVSEKLGIKLGVQCYTYRALSFFETVDKAVMLGLRYVEAYPNQKVRPGAKDTMARKAMSEELEQAILNKLHDTGVRLVAYGVDDVPLDEAAARADFVWAKKMGIEVLVTATTPNAVQDKLCNEFGIKLVLHNHPKQWLPDEVLKACMGLSPMVGACADTGHWMTDGLEPVLMFKKLGERVLHAHFKDRNGFGPGPDVPLGTGKSDNRAMLAELMHQGFKGYLSLEYENGSIAELDVNLATCITFVDSTLASLAAAR
jgi:sugar phosphate isomerase/epimerase